MSHIWPCLACGRVSTVDDDGRCPECQHAEQQLVTDGGRDRVMGVTSIDADRYVTERVYECSDRECEAVSGYLLNDLCPVCYGAEWVMVVRRALL